MIELVHEGGEPKKPSQTVMMICATLKEKSIDEEAGVQLKWEDVKPVVILGKNPSAATRKPEPAKLVITGASSATVVVVKGVCREPVIIKPVVQTPVIDSKAVPWKYEKAVVMYKGQQVEENSCEAHGLTRSGRCFAPAELRRPNPAATKKPVSEEKAEEFLKKMKVQDYSVVEQLKKTPAQILLLSLLIHSDEHRRALMKILNEAHVPNEISVNHLEMIANKIFEVNRVTFSDDDLPVEGMEHNKALYLTVKCEDSAVTRALVDNGSSSNICPLSTLNQLKIDHGRIHKNSICIRGFDGNGTATVGDIVLELTIGPVEFTMEFQVLDVAVSYNLLLGRPWIHAAKAVPSTLHQMVKFEWDRQDVVLHGEDFACTIGGAIVPFIETNDDKGPWVYQIFDAVSANKIPEGTSIPHPRIASATVMIVSEMLSNGFVPGKGLGAELQGIVQPVSLPKNVETFGMGFKPTSADVRHARKMKKKVWVLPKPVTCLSRSFVIAGTRKLSVPKVLGPMIGPDGDLDEGFERLFAGVNMVEAGEGSSRVDIQFVGPRAKINSWTATPLPTRRESW
ncbi:uncharacterized protein LOC142172928 isoform X2 [Nicotiana tabacum]|uniref:Uncharacterized protein LOC142172928 isoform X2 n=1 Tax=Nicotiana tabacum TaxID=4097 RepID=A0AC58T7D3_TOBAC